MAFGMFKFQMKQFTESIKHFEESLQIFEIGLPGTNTIEKARALSYIGKCYYNNGKSDQAKENLNRSKAIYPSEYPKILKNL